MIIIFEGANCVGKTIYAEKLAKISGLPLLKFGLVGNVTEAEHKIDIISKAENNLFATLASSIELGSCIIDRLYASDFVYSQLKEGRSFSVDYYRQLESFYKFSSNKIVHIFLHCDDSKELAKRREENNEQYVVTSEVDREIALFEDFFYNFTKLTYSEFDTSRREDIDKNVRKIYNLIY